MDKQSISETQSIMRLQWGLPREQDSWPGRLRSLLEGCFRADSTVPLRVRVGGFAGPKNPHRGHR